LASLLGLQSKADNLSPNNPTLVSSALPLEYRESARLPVYIPEGMHSQAFRRKDFFENFSSGCHRKPPVIGQPSISLRLIWLIPATGIPLASAGLAPGWRQSSQISEICLANSRTVVASMPATQQPAVNWYR